LDQIKYYPCTTCEVVLISTDLLLRAERWGKRWEHSIQNG